jgi:hypothetical protein
MAEKKRGFHALEERIHQMEDEDQKREKMGSPSNEDAQRNASQQQERDRDQPRKK